MRLLIVITFLLSSPFAKGQHYVVSYQYDDNGNRICQRALQVAPFNPKTGTGDSTAQIISPQSDTLYIAGRDHFYSQVNPAVKDGKKDRKAKDKSQLCGTL